MHANDEFLWGGLRGRLERMGRVRPRTIRLEAVGQLPERTPQVSFRPAQPALLRRVQAAQPARVT